VDNHGRIWVMARDGLEYRQPRQCRCHPRDNNAESMHKGALRVAVGKPVAQTKWPWSCEW
jgi:hypothetical protein